jgi:nucleotide-binding universal stress UspA family protein
MKTILSPTDFSDVSINAVKYAADMAAAIQARLLILHAVEVPVAVAEMPVAGIGFEELNSEDHLMKLKHSLLARTNNKVPIEAKQLWGALENELVKTCGYNKPFAIVMGTHGDGLAERYFLESTTVYMAKHFNYSVLVVPEGINFKPIQKIVLATDLKDVDELPWQQIAGLLTVFNATLHIVYVNKNDKQAGKAFMEDSFSRHPLKKLNPHFHVVENNNVQKGISFFAEENNADLVLILPKKHGFFHKSDSRQFIFRSPVPVMAIHKE